MVRKDCMANQYQSNSKAYCDLNYTSRDNLLSFDIRFSSALDSAQYTQDLPIRFGSIHSGPPHQIQLSTHRTSPLDSAQYTQDLPIRFSSVHSGPPHLIQLSTIRTSPLDSALYTQDLPIRFSSVLIFFKLTSTEELPIHYSVDCHFVNIDFEHYILQFQL